MDLNHMSRLVSGLREPDLLNCHNDLNKVNESVEDLVRNLSDTQLQWKPEAEVWSISQCLEHLLVTARADLPHIHRAIDDGRSRKVFGQGPFRYGLFGRLLILSMGAPARVKVKAPQVYRPVGNKGSEEILREFFLAQREMLDCIRAADGLHLAKVKTSLPGRKYIRLSLGQEFRLIIVHEQRHVWQAQQIKIHPRFPWTPH